jgi:hypothetical protein
MEKKEHDKIIELCMSSRMLAAIVYGLLRGLMLPPTTSAIKSRWKSYRATRSMITQMNKKLIRLVRSKWIYRQFTRVSQKFCAAYKFAAVCTNYRPRSFI